MRRILVVIGLLSVAAFAVQGRGATLGGAWGAPGYSVVSQSPTEVEIVYSLDRFEIEEYVHEGEAMHVVSIPGPFLPGEAGAPNLPSAGRFVAIPQGASVRLAVLESRTEVYTDVNLAPAPRIPLETDDSPPVLERDPVIYGTDALYPAEPVRMSEPMRLRGVDAVILGVTPFQYNPVSRELVVYRDMRVRLEFEGGNGCFGEDRLRSRFWEPILRGHLLNYASLPEIDFYDPVRRGQEGWEYVIIVPDDPAFTAWGDTLKAWRKLQGISTEVFTITEVGGNTVEAIEAFVDSAYYHWEVPPVAFLLLSDYENSGDGYGITSPLYADWCVSDNVYADVDGDDLPDLTFARICAQNVNQLRTMVGKILAYERAPSTDPGFYDHPLVACAWQTERWFQLCAEVVRGYFIHGLGKHPAREYAIYSGYPVPDGEWSSDLNTWMIVDHFGESGLGYIPDVNPYGELWWSNGSAEGINAAINAGAFLVLHRDHGDALLWVEPMYTTSHMAGLTNDMYPFVFSINCLTGMFDYTFECFAEAFHRHEHGALGLIAATGVSFSFVNDTYLWGLFDFMWPDFMPDYPSLEMPLGGILMPGFASVSGKCFLAGSNWPSNPSLRSSVHYLFHMLGDAFTTLYTEVPQELGVFHDSTMVAGGPYFTVSADEGSVIALTVEGEIVGVAEGIGLPRTLAIPPLEAGDTLVVTITKPNRFRYESHVPVEAVEGPYPLLYEHLIDDSAGGNGNGVIDIGESIQMPAAVKNVGTEAVEGVGGVLSTEDPLVTITDEYEYFGEIEPDEVVWGGDDFEFDVSSAAPDEHVASFVLDLSDTSGTTWISALSLVVHAPVLVFEDVLVDDSGGNGNGRPDPGETCDLTVSLHNDGTGDASGVEGVLSTGHPNVTVTVSSAAYPDIPSGMTGASFTPYVIEVSPEYPPGTYATFALSITADGPYAATDSFELLIGRKPILFVDDDNGQFIEHYLIDALTDLGQEFDLWEVLSQASPLPGDLEPYKLVIWTTGDGPSMSTTLTDDDQRNVAEYLDGGGKFFLTSQDYLWDARYSFFTTDYLHVGWYDLEEPVAQMTGVSHDSIGEGLVLDLVYPFMPWSDDMRPDGLALGFLLNTEHMVAPDARPGEASSPVRGIGHGEQDELYGAIRYPASGPSPFQTLFMCVPFEAVPANAPPPNNQTELLRRILIWFGFSPPEVSIVLEPDMTSYAPGDTLRYTATVRNNLLDPVVIHAMAEVTLPNGQPYAGNPVVGPRSISLGPGESLTRDLGHVIPPGAPAGIYRYTATVGEPPNTVIDSDSFEFEVSPE